MRHHNNTRKFGRDKTQKRALLNSLALNLIAREKIKTTEPKAKELRPFIEKLITRAKKGDMATRRIVAAKLSNRGKEVKKLFEILAPKYADKKGGYTRVLKLGARKSDGAKMAIIEFI
ncbi:MAG: 50S ribosomal protein L17 [Candidatus Nomurabacteria bacterium GW2011_GWB1_40_7]|uniref:Large ribosomal subunit protein bL17 n=1 Tax=Candidatus Nomurabacteria bacterium GW2011_GWB1_40_7 TaxID=1618744 RepID=A0A0G0T7R7_9BACT|nr:MAG: 50S ribosomal protein L17 [Candidatus Nomurabacteria bacterium GW2011_GWB1_40_7]